MKKMFQSPTIDVLQFDTENVLTASQEAECVEDKFNPSTDGVFY